MARSRTDVYNMLVDLLESKNVYFNPPEGFKLEYPCIIYGVQRLGNGPADNVPYFLYDQYTITYIYKHDEDAALVEKMRRLPRFSYDRNYISDNLRHVVFNYSNF